MKFHIAINLERIDPSTDMLEMRDHTLEMVQMADEAGFEIVWAAEHHALEMTIAPNPFHLMTWWADHTKQIRVGAGVANAAYWHPIKLAGEAALCDLLSGGRMEFGVGSGAYQREFDRMFPGLDQKDSWRYMQEMLPQGDLLSETHARQHSGLGCGALAHHLRLCGREQLQHHELAADVAVFRGREISRDAR